MQRKSLNVEELQALLRKAKRDREEAEAREQMHLDQAEINRAKSDAARSAQRLLESQLEQLMRAARGWHEQ